MRSEAKKCVAVGCHHEAERSNLFCRNHWNRLTSAHRAGIASPHSTTAVEALESARRALAIKDNLWAAA